MNVFSQLGMAFAVGGALGGLYLLLLWHSLRLLTREGRPTLLFAAGALVRIGLVLLGMYAILHLGDWRHAASAVAGFALVRGLVGWHMASRQRRTANQGG